MTLQDDRLSEVSLTRSALGSCQGYNPEFYAKVMVERGEWSKPPESRSMEREETSDPPTLDHIMDRILALPCFSGVRRKDVASASQSHETVIARQMYCHLAAKYTEKSPRIIAETIGKERTTVFYNVRAWPGAKDRNRAWKANGKAGK